MLQNFFQNPRGEPKPYTLWTLKKYQVKARLPDKQQPQYQEYLISISSVGHWLSGNDQLVFCGIQRENRFSRHSSSKDSRKHDYHLDSPKMTQPRTELLLLKWHRGNVVRG